ncbi:MAG: response regulator [Candidatus Acidiferrales bacterium]
MKKVRTKDSSPKSANGRSSTLPALRERIAELEQTLGAIRRGDVDALVIKGPGGERVFLLQGAEHPYRVLVETINEGAAMLDGKGAVLYANSRFAEFVGLPLEKFIGTQLQDHVSDTERPKLQALLASGARGSAKGQIELELSGVQKRLIRLSLSPVKDADLQTICAVATDLTELSDANDALKINEEALRQLSTRLLELQDEERRRISRDLHDVTGQKLALQCIALSRMTRLLSPTANEETRDSIAQCLDLTNQISEEIRTLSYLLHPPLLDELGLPSAVKWFAQGFQQRTGICVDVDIAHDLPRLRPDVEVALFRVVQESLTNVHRYSESPTAYVRVSRDRDEFKLEVGDSGKGMQIGKTKIPGADLAPLGVGIQGMRQRIRQFSGRLEILSKLGKGTVVLAVLPIRELCLQIQGEEKKTSQEEEGHRKSGNEETGSRRRILIADDHELLRRGVRSMLENETDLQVCGEAIDGIDAVEKTLTLSPDLVILDINMPALNGLATVRQILRARPETKILIFTVHDSEQTVHESFLAGAHGFLSKGKAGRDLVDAVRAVVAGEQFYPNIRRKAAATVTN